MPLRSMTGFSRAEGTEGDTRFYWELRSVNGRGLDVRLRLPPGFDSLDPLVREAIGKPIARGNVSATLTLDAASAAGQIRINERALGTVLDVVERLVNRDGFDRARPEGVLALRGVLEVADSTSQDNEALRTGIMAALAVAVDGLVAARESEGTRLGFVLSSLVASIESLVARIAALPSRKPEAVRARIEEQVQRLVGTSSSLDPERLHQEAMMLATRADVEEEIKRLEAHSAAARVLLADVAPAGRRLDFLSQEFNREANTICSKSIDVEMTRLGLELKAVIDQVREQVQNIE